MVEIRFGDMKCGREKPQCCGGGGSPFHREKGRKQERAQRIRVHTRCCGLGIRWVTLGKNVPLPGVPLEEGILPLHGQSILQVPLNSHSTTRDRGLRRGQITWLQPFTVLYHRLQAPMWLFNCFSGTEWCQVQCSEALLLGRRVGLCLAGCFKTWEF